MKNWEKLIRIHSDNTAQNYYLAAKHTVNKLGRNITVSSPLQVKKNVLCVYELTELKKRAKKQFTLYINLLIIILFKKAQFKIS